MKNPKLSSDVKVLRLDDYSDPPVHSEFFL